MRNRTAKLGGALLLILMAGCASLTDNVREQGIFPREIPNVPPPQASAVQVPLGYRAEVFAKDLIYPTSIAFDGSGNVHVAEAGYAYGDIVAPARVLQIRPDGRMSYVAEQLNGPITDLLWHNGRLYISHFRTISVLEPTGRVRDIVTDLPSTGEHQNNQMSVGPDGKIYFGQGTATNSGVVGLDSAIPYLWLAYWPDLHDIPARDIALRGEVFTTPHVNNVAAKQSTLVTLPSNLGQFVASIFHTGPGTLLARTVPFSPSGTTRARSFPAR